MGGSRFVIRVDAGPAIGHGHVSRMRSLAEALVRRGAAVDVIGDGISIGRGAGAPWSIRALSGPAGDELVDVPRTSALIGSPDPDVLIVDHYALGEAWERGMAERLPRTRIVAVDDLPDRAHAADMLIDPNLGPVGPKPVNGSSPRVLAGTAYAPLGDEYLAPARERARVVSNPNLLVTLGGGRSEFVGPLAAALGEDARLSHVDLEFVVPDPAEHAEVSLILGRRTRCTVHGGVPTLRPLLERADLVIGAGGTSAWQRLRLGRPSVTITLSQNQVRTGQALQDLGLTRWVESTAGISAIVEAAVESLDDEDLFRSVHEAGPLLVDGRGAERIALALMPPPGPPTLRAVEEGDAAALLAMANDPNTRAASREPRSICPQEHLEWFRRMRDFAGPTFWVAEVDGLVVGQVRFMALAVGWELNYGLDPIARGLGWSTPMVREGLRRLRSEGREGPVFAVVHISNEASRSNLAKVGFLPDEAGMAVAAGVRLPDGFSAYRLSDRRLAH